MPPHSRAEEETEGKKKQSVRSTRQMRFTGHVTEEEGGQGKEGEEASASSRKSEEGKEATKATYSQLNKWEMSAWGEERDGKSQVAHINESRRMHECAIAST